MKTTIYSFFCKQEDAATIEACLTQSLLCAGVSAQAMMQSEEGQMHITFFTYEKSDMYIYLHNLYTAGTIKAYMVR